MTAPFATPVVLCVYNRPEATRQLLAVLGRVKPKRMLIVADGPSPAKPTDAVLCRNVDQAIQSIDWDVTVDTHRASTNLGCRKRMQSGLTWAFDQVSEAIILEDDCIPHPSFFPFCDELLDHYRSDRRVGVICGANFQFGADCGPASYFFSRYPLVWGWAAWRRTWDCYDRDIDAWPALRETSWLTDHLKEPLPVAYWRRMFDHVRSGYDTWDVSLVLSCWRQQMLALQPRLNLVSNIGFGPDATHTRMNSIFANIPACAMPFPLSHPAAVERDAACDQRTEQWVFSGTPKQRLRAAFDQLCQSSLGSPATADAPSRPAPRRNAGSGNPTEGSQ